MVTPENIAMGDADGHGRPSEGDDPIPPLSTHDIRTAIHHAPKFKKIIEALQYASERASCNPGSISRYKHVNVLILRWDYGDNPGFQQEAETLGSVFSDSYGFNVEKWDLPSAGPDGPTIYLAKRMIEWIRKYKNETNLLIVYYAGHCNGTHERFAKLKWSVCENLLQEARADTLFLLDCCFAAAAASTPLKGFSETIAASGWEMPAPGPGYDSFTCTLSYILRDWAITKPTGFSVANLHAALLLDLKAGSLRLTAGDAERPGGWRECRATPVHYILSSSPSQPSIILSPLKKRTKEAGRSLSKNPDNGVLDKEDRGTTQEPLPKSLKVVLNITLTEDIPGPDTANACRRWLSSFPLPTKDIKFEAVFKGRSTVVLASVPVEVWDLLPDIPGVNFVCFAKSENLLGETGQVTTGQDQSLSSDTGGYLSERSSNLPGKNPSSTRDTKLDSSQSSH
ncbi:hypothetical protein V8F20_010966 [Naviculisporaceae sp. PSN 640]